LIELTFSFECPFEGVTVLQEFAQLEKIIMHRLAFISSGTEKFLDLRMEEIHRSVNIETQNPIGAFVENC